jgi:carbon starvation protein
VQEIAEIAGWHKLARNLTFAGLVAVAVPLAMALIPGGGDAGYTFGVLWRLFGTTNQLTAGLALTVVAVWVMRMKRNPLPAIVPLVFLLVMTTWALFIQFWDFLQADTWSEKFVLAPLDAIIFALAIWLIVEAVMALRGGGRRAYDEMGSPLGDESTPVK